MLAQGTIYPIIESAVPITGKPGNHYRNHNVRARDMKFKILTLGVNVQRFSELALLGIPQY